MPVMLKKVGVLLGALFVFLSARGATAAPPSGAAAPPVKPLELSAPPRDTRTPLPGLVAVDPLTIEGPGFLWRPLQDGRDGRCASSRARR